MAMSFESRLHRFLWIGNISLGNERAFSFFRLKHISSPLSEIKFSHKEESSSIKISSDSEIKKATLHCLNEEIELKGGSLEAKECLLPAYITYELRRNGFIF